jgi:hypothetical protein
MPHPALAVTDEQYRNDQDILWQVPCDQTPPAAQQAKDSQPAPTAGGGGGGNCGEQGYGGGARDSQANKQQIWSFLKGKGLSDEAAAGIMGNMDKESAYMPDAENSLGCRGVVQWCFGRVDGLNEWAAAHNSNWNCLGTQLEYMWHEMTETSESQVMGPLQGSRSASEAANTFHDLYERSNTATGEQLGRAERGEKAYREFTGKDAGQSAATEDKSQSPSTVSDPNSCTASVAQQTGQADSNGQPIGPRPPSTCGAVLDMVRLINSGKIDISNNKAGIEKDFNHCTTDQISCGTGEGQPGGVNPKVLRALADTAQNSGASQLAMWNLNSGHGCDGLNLPNGKASDIRCQGNQLGQTTASDDCNKIFKWLYDHYDEFELEELIWQYPPAGYSCSNPKIMCDIEGHTDHIHIGVR